MKTDGQIALKGNADVLSYSEKQVISNNKK